jgi:hypothetical protein
MDALAARRAFAAGIPGGYRPLRHLAGCLAFGFLVPAAVLSRLAHVAPAEWLALPIALMACNLFEYVGHRWVMHVRTTFLPYAYEAHALRHHRAFDPDHMSIESPRDLGLLLFAPRDTFFFSMTSWPALALTALLASRNVLVLTAAAVPLHYLFYELAHLVSHLPADHWIARRRLVAGFRRRHALHHGDPQVCFNVTLPLCDWLFGTRRRAAPPLESRPTGSRARG